MGRKLFAVTIAVLLTLSACTQAPAPQESFSQSTVSVQTTETTVAGDTTATSKPADKAPIVTEPGFDPALIVSTMTPEEKVGQLFLARCPDAGALKDIETYHLGGFILFGRDFENQTPHSIASTIDAYQDASQIPMLIAVDEEGGTVTRVSSNSAFRGSCFSSPRNLYSKGGMELVLQTEEEKAVLLSSLGINVNMAPVCDITTTPWAFMYKRSLGADPQTTGQFAAATSAIMKSQGIGSVLKHFPGYGNNTDTHTGSAVDNRPMNDLLSTDLVPFSIGIQGGCGAILVSHTIVSCLDEKYPATLSPAVHRFMRDELDFNGVIITDDLVMEAISDQYSDGEAAVLAVLAGNDLLCATNYAVQYSAVLEAARSGRIHQHTLDTAVCRVLQWKYDLGLLPDNTVIPKNS